jgi:DNA helicase II / ATP-dependent DNA helicase PcrA
MEVLLAAPGTGKTTKIKNIIDERFKDATNILVLSFTNATINDLNTTFKDSEKVKCYTLHKYALLINHLPHNHILSELEISLLDKFSDKVRMSFSDLCSILNCMTFEMMISESISFIETNPAYAEEKIGTIDLLVIDEFQDFNELERSLLNLLFAFSKNIIILGDDDQSIYSFKNADPEALIALYNDETNTKVGHDHICYRCPDKIVDSCTSLINNNTIRVIKEWYKSKKDGEIKVLQGKTHALISKYIIDQINEIRRSAERETILILCWQKIAAYPVVASFEEKGIEYVDFLKKDIDKQDYYLIWWLRAIFGNHLLLNTIFIICYHRLYTRIKLIEKFKDYFKDTSYFNELLNLILSYSTSLPAISKYLFKTPDIQEFFKENVEFEKFKEYINKNDIVNSVDEIVKNFFKSMAFDPTKVNIMTIHKSKGLQADNVFILGLTEGLLPNRSEGTDNLEAQRRLLYVGMTRAMKRLWLISCIQWETKDILASGADKKQFKHYGREIMFGKTSSFIHEIKLPVSAI